MMTHQDNDVQKTCRCLAQCLSLAQDKHLLIALVVDKRLLGIVQQIEETKHVAHRKYLIVDQCNERMQ